MAKNPFIGPKVPWIKVYRQTKYLRQWHNNNTSFSLIPDGPGKCIFRCKDPSKAAHKISLTQGHLLIRISDLDYGAYENACGHSTVRKHLAYEHLVYLLQLHRAFYDEQ